MDSISGYPAAMDESGRGDESQRDSRLSPDDGSIEQNDDGEDSPAGARSGKKKGVLSEHPLLSSVAAAVISGVILAAITPLFDVDKSSADVATTTSSVSTTVVSEPVGAGEASDSSSTQAPPTTTLPAVTAPPSEVELPSSVSSLAQAGEAIKALGAETDLRAGVVNTYRLGSTISGSFSARVPDAWSDEDGYSSWIVGPGDGVTAGDAYLASTNIANMYRYTAPGFFIGVSSADPDPRPHLPGLDDAISQGCRSAGPMEIQGSQSGRLDAWLDCETRALVKVDFELEGESGYLGGSCFIFTKADMSACAELLASLEYDGALARPSEVVDP